MGGTLPRAFPDPDEDTVAAEPIDVHVVYVSAVRDALWLAREGHVGTPEEVRALQVVAGLVEDRLGAHATGRGHEATDLGALPRYPAVAPAPVLEAKPPIPGRMRTGLPAPGTLGVESSTVEVAVPAEAKVEQPAPVRPVLVGPKIPEAADDAAPDDGIVIDLDAMARRPPESVWTYEPPAGQRARPIPDELSFDAEPADSASHG